VTVDIPLRCSCGRVRGLAKDVSAERGNRLVCMCNDCQAYAHWLGQADTLLDEYGGTDVYPLTPSQMTFTAGADQIRCLRLTPRGLLRWHTECCKTPVGNTLASARVPFVGVPLLCMDHLGDGWPRESILGPVRAKGAWAVLQRRDAC